ncbi:hypothetical protein [Propionimicrobium sp. PCR01-08-3]|uniref:hypothetical protein n=1 Tax=Propionimicrobium sp. PCR01-08-3 TaxID=3052086 RepID=UPI00255C66CB|nr:hypothetical protein [Propionimicrobium sp. PCR01-08-3]WIY84331.1 hypothetical protein QQ658_15075 [Propionimicrobium sp. PCR01-08-3]
MAKVNVELNHAKIAQFLKGTDVTSAVRSAGNTVKGRCGDGFEADVSTKGDRSRAYVRAVSAKAKLKQAKDHAIEKAVGEGL